MPDILAAIPEEEIANKSERRRTSGAAGSKNERAGEFTRIRLASPSNEYNSDEHIEKGSADQGILLP